jgi:hypothetical protein
MPSQAKDATAEALRQGLPEMRRQMFLYQIAQQKEANPCCHKFEVVANLALSRAGRG